MIEGRGNAVREDDELDFEEEGEERNQINRGGDNELPEHGDVHEEPDNELLPMTRQDQEDRSAIDGDIDGSQESYSGDEDSPIRSPGKDDDTGSVPDDSPSVQVSSFP